MSLTIRQLGYLTKNALKAWHRAFEQRQDLPTAFWREPKYTPAQWQLAVDHFVDNGRCLAVTIKALGYPSKSLLAGWIRDAYPGQRPQVGQSRETLSSQAKQSAVMALCLGSAQAVAMEFGVSRPSALSRFLEDGDVAFDKTTTSKAKSLNPCAHLNSAIDELLPASLETRRLSAVLRLAAYARLARPDR